jgi:hypothetical protein
VIFLGFRAGMGSSLRAKNRVSGAANYTSKVVSGWFYWVCEFDFVQKWAVLGLLAVWLQHLNQENAMNGFRAIAYIVAIITGGGAMIMTVVSHEVQQRDINYLLQELAEAQRANLNLGGLLAIQDAAHVQRLKALEAVSGSQEKRIVAGTDQLSTLERKQRVIEGMHGIQIKAEDAQEHAGDHEHKE